MQFLTKMKMAITKNNNEIRLMGANDFKVLVLGVTHGDEPQGHFLINEYLKQHPDTKLGFIPALNPDGMANKNRVNANGVDINRNFPTKNWELTERNEFFGGEFASSEIETQFLIDIIENHSPKLILSLHAPFKTVNFDGNAYKYAEKISEIMNYPVQEDIGYPTPGSFGTYAGIEKNIPTITLELDEECDIKELISPVFRVFKYLETLIL